MNTCYLWRIFGDAGIDAYKNSILSKWCAMFVQNVPSNLTVKWYLTFISHFKRNWSHYYKW